MPTTLEYSLDEVPFSMRGSWLSVSRVTGLHTRSTLVHLVSHQTGMHPILSIQPLHGSVPVDMLPTTTPQQLRWQTDAGFVEIAFADVDMLRLRG